MQDTVQSSLFAKERKRELQARLYEAMIAQCEETTKLRKMERYKAYLLCMQIEEDTKTTESLLDPATHTCKI